MFRACARRFAEGPPPPPRPHTHTYRMAPAQRLDPPHSGRIIFLPDTRCACFIQTAARPQPRACSGQAFLAADSALRVLQLLAAARKLRGGLATGPGWGIRHCNAPATMQAAGVRRGLLEEAAPGRLDGDLRGVNPPSPFLAAWCVSAWPQSRRRVVQHLTGAGQVSSELRERTPELLCRCSPARLPAVLPFPGRRCALNDKVDSFVGCC